QLRAAALPARALGPVAVDGDVPAEDAAERIGADIGPPVGDERAAEPGAERQARHHARPPPRPEAPLAPRVRPRVVLDGERNAERLAEGGAEVLPRQQRALADVLDDTPGVGIDEPFDREAARRELVAAAHVERVLDEVGEEVALGEATQRGLLERHGLAGLGEDADLDVGPAVVHAESHHGRPSAGKKWRRAPTRCARQLPHVWPSGYSA